MIQQQTEDCAKADGVTGASPSFLDGYISEREYARQRGVSVRTAQRDRQLGDAPPFVVLGKKVFYRLAGLEQWLLKRERASVCTPVRAAGPLR